jgi:DNA mismatch repair protein MutL
MIEISEDYDQDWQGPIISGIIGTPEQKRSNRSRIFLFVNERLVQSRTISFAFEQAYKGFSSDNKFPIGAIALRVPLDEVDVNVHPAKTEVRFKNESQVFSIVQGGVRSTLLKQSPVQSIVNHSQKYPKFVEGSEPSAFWPTALSTGGFEAGGTPVLNAFSEQSTIIRYQEVLPLLRVLGQVSDTYIVCEGPDGIYMIDQHAAHERIIFEKIAADAKRRTIETQMLLEPINLELDSNQEILIEENKDIFDALGMIPEPFGPNSYLIRNVPKVLAEADPRDSFHKMLSALSEQVEFKSWEDKAAYSLACHAAIRAGKKMSYREMSLLVKQLESCLQPNNCPHGRPTMINMNKNHLEREFSRI